MCRCRRLLGYSIVTGLLLVPALPALAGADVFFGLTIGVPLAPYPVYAPVYGALAAALRGEGPAPSAEGNALDVAVVRAAYQSARDGIEVRVDADGPSA